MGRRGEGTAQGWRGRPGFQVFIPILRPLRLFPHWKDMCILKPHRVLGGRSPSHADLVWHPRTRSLVCWGSGGSSRKCLKKTPRAGVLRAGLRFLAVL